MKPFIIRNNKIKKILIIAFWILVWWGLSLLINREIYLPSPFTTFKAFLSLSIESKFWLSIAMSFFRVILGFLLSCLFGILFGIVSGLRKGFYEVFNPFMVAIKSTPVMSIIIIALIWFHSNWVPVFVCFLMCFPIIWTNVVEGIRQVDKKLLDMAKVYRVNRKLVLKRIYVPSLTPYLVAGVITSLGLGWKVTVAAEVLSNPKFSIGGHLYDAKVYLESPELFAWTSVVIALSFVFEHFFKLLLKKLKYDKGSMLV